MENNGKIETQIPITDKDSQEIIIDIVMEGKSAYDVAVERGFDGTIEEWLLSLHGEPGYTPVKGVDYFDGKDGKDADVDGIQAQFDTVEERLDSTDAQLNNMTQDFTQHKLDYTEQAEFPLINLVKNGDFSNGFVNWSNNGSTISVTDKVAKQVATVAGVSSVYQEISPSNLAGDKLYIRTMGRRLNAEISSLSLYTYNGSASSIMATFTPPIGTWEALSTIITSPSSGTYTRVYLRMNTTLIGAIAEWRNVLVINLTTSFGAGNEPTTEQMDLIMAELGNWFDGKVQLSNFRKLYFKVKEIEDDIGIIVDDSISINKIQGSISGKNLFNPDKITVNRYINTTTNEIINSANYNISEPISVIIGEPYTLYNCRSVGQFDESDILISSTDLGDSENNIVTIIATQPFIKVSVHKTRLYTAQVEKGDIFTGYEPHKRLIPLSLIEPLKTGGGNGEVYDQSLNTTDNVKFASVLTSGTIPTGTFASPPSGLVKGDVWADTTDGSTHPILRVML